MKIFELATVCIVFGSGCTGDPAPIHVAIHTGDPPALVAFRNESDPQWRPLAVDGASMFDVIVTGPYRVVVACDTFDGFSDIREYARTPTDSLTIEDQCHVYPFIAHGKVVQPGGMFLGGYGVIGVTPNWTFDLPVAASTFDLVLLSGDYNVAFDAVAVRRGIAIGGDTQLGTIDFTSEIMHPLQRRSFTPSNFEVGESTYSNTILYAGNTIAGVDDTYLQSTPSWEARLVPDGLLQPTDHQVVSFSTVMSMTSGAAKQTRYRNVRREARSDAASSVALPDPLASVRFELPSDRLVATWDTLPVHDELTLERESVSSDGSQDVFHQAVFSATYLDSTRATNVVLDFSDVPGFQNQWRHDPRFQQRFGLFADRGASIYDSSTTGMINTIDASRQPTAAPLSSSDRQAAHRDRSHLAAVRL